MDKGMPLLRQFTGTGWGSGGGAVVGFRLIVVMLGTHSLTGGDSGLPLLFHLTWGHDDLAAYSNPFSGEFLRAPAAGFITAGGLVHRAECSGTIALRYFSGGKVLYELDFSDDRGRAYRYTGEKRDIRPWNLHRTHTTATARSRISGPALSCPRLSCVFPSTSYQPS
jgi:hypothetical protein